MVLKGTPKRRSTMGRPPKPAGERASKFVGVKMTAKTFDKLKELVKWHGKGATKSSVIVELLRHAWAEGDPRQRPQPEGGPKATPQPSPEDREAAIAAAQQRFKDARGEKAQDDALRELERLRGEPSFGGKS